jgi:hypothetical protein
LAYLGNRPAESFASFEKQVFTIVNSQTAYTLSHSVTNENDIRLVVNSVVQEPGSGKAYTASGTTLTLSAALTNGTDTMYCVFLGRALQTVNPPNASVGSDQTAPTIITGQTAETSIATDDTILIHDTSASALKKMTRANFVSGIGGTNTPNFYAYRSGNQSLSDATTTRVNFNAEIYDTANAFDSAGNHRFVPQTAGKYHLLAYFFVGGSSANTEEAQIYIYKNGSSTFFYEIDNRSGTNGYNTSQFISAIVEANGSSDYFEVYARVKGAGTKNLVSGANQCWFQGYKIIE